MKLWYYDAARRELVFMDPIDPEMTGRTTMNVTTTLAHLQAAGWLVDHEGLRAHLPVTSRGTVTL